MVPTLGASGDLAMPA